MQAGTLRQPDDGFAYLLRYMAAKVPAGTRVAVTDDDLAAQYKLRTANRMTCGNSGVHVMVETGCEEGAAATMVRRGRAVGPDRAVAAVIPRRADHPGCTRLDDRKVLCSILFVLYNGIPCGSSYRRSWGSAQG